MALAKEFGLDGLSASELTSAASVLSRPAEEFGNSADIEMRWAVKAYHHAETYFNLITSLDPKLLRLTKYDDEIYNKFRQEFPNEDIAIINQDIMKSKEGKEKWRPFCECFKDNVEDYNFASLIRTDCSKDYSEDNSFVVPKIQFLAVEIARNREGFNSPLRDSFAKSSKN